MKKISAVTYIIVLGLMLRLVLILIRDLKQMCLLEILGAGSTRFWHRQRITPDKF